MAESRGRRCKCCLCLGKDKNIFGKDNVMGKKRRRKGIFIWLLAAAMIFGAAGTTGCGRTGAGGEASDSGNDGGTPAGEAPLGAAVDEEGGFGSNGTSSADGTEAGEKVMGRYLESADETLKGEMGGGGTLVEMEDGSLAVMSGNYGKWVSEDAGATWEREKMAWHEELVADKCWVMNTALAKNGDIAIIYAGGEESTEKEGEEEGGGAFSPKYGIASADGTFRRLELSFRESEYVNRLAFSEDGRLFGSAIDGKVYEIDRDQGTVEELIELSEWVQYMTEKDGKLMLVNGDGVTILDLATGETVEDRVMNDFLHEQLGSHISSDTEGIVSLLLMPGEDGILYLACEKGIYRHVTEGNVIEQVVDGTITSLSDPSCGISDGVLLENDVFLLLLADGRLMRYTYDPDMPAAPEVQLRAYSLRDNPQMKKVISAFQAEHPEVYIRYEIGMEENSPVTRDDALKKLNTEIAAGKGPDIFILDDMPIDSYAEKGVLMDLSPWLEKKTEDLYFTNIIHAFRTAEGTYAAPSQFHIGLVAGRRSDIGRMGDLEAIAGLVEEYDEEKADGIILGIKDESELLNVLLPVCLPAWTNQDGKIDKDALAEFYASAKKMWDIEEARMSEEQKAEYERWEEERRIAGVSDEKKREYQIRLSEIGLITGEKEFTAGMVSDSSSFDVLISCFKVPGKEDNSFAAYNGQAKGVFMPESLIGINAASPYQETALELAEKMLDDDGWLGMPVNKEKWSERFRQNATEDGGSYASMGGSKGDEKEEYYHLDIYPASEEEIGQLMEIVEAARIPYVKNSVLEKAVCETGEKVLAGEMSPSAGAEEVIQKTAIYMSE